MTLQEIARLANVSVATVSRTINRVPTVDPLLARRVRRVIEKAGYYPNTHARAPREIHCSKSIPSHYRDGGRDCRRLNRHGLKCDQQNWQGQFPNHKASKGRDSNDQMATGPKCAEAGAKQRTDGLSNSRGMSCAAFSILQNTGTH